MTKLLGIDVEGSIYVSAQFAQGEFTTSDISIKIKDDLVTFAYREDHAGGYDFLVRKLKRIEIVKDIFERWNDGSEQQREEFKVFEELFGCGVRTFEFRLAAKAAAGSFTIVKRSQLSTGAGETYATVKVRSLEA